MVSNLANIKSALRIALALMLLFPFLVLVGEINASMNFDTKRFFEVFVFTVVQASLSGISILLFGLLGALGLFHYSSKKVEIFVLLPSLVPSLFILVGCLKFFNPFPFGMLGIVIVQTVIYSGLCSVALKTLFESKIGSWCELALIEGSGRRAFLLVVLRFLKNELALMFLFFFSLTFSSLSVPLVAGGFNGQTLEVMIYEKIRIDMDFGQAFFLSLIQSFFLLALCWRLSQLKSPLATKSFNTHLLRFAPGIYPLTLFCVVILWGQLLDLSGGIEDLIQLKETVSFFDAGIRSLFISFASGLFMMVLLASVAYVLPHKNFQRFLLSYMAPSTALLGLAWLKWTPPSTGAVSLVIIVVGLCFLSLPLIYRLRLDSAFHSLTHQIDVASTMGADWNQIFWRIVIPQLWPSLCLGASLMAFWAAGEFAFSSLVAPSDFSLSLLTKGLTDSYRIEAASTLSWLNLVLGLMGWLFFRSLKDVFSYRAH